MVACAVVAIFGLVVTLVCVSEDVDSSSEEEENAGDRVPMRVVLSEPSLVDYYHRS